METLPTISNLNEVIRRIRKAQQLTEHPKLPKPIFPYVQAYSKRPTTSVYSRIGAFHQHNETYEGPSKKPRLASDPSGDLDGLRYSTPCGRTVNVDFMQVSPVNLQKQRLDLKRLSLHTQKRGKLRQRVAKLVVNIAQPKQKSSAGAHVNSNSFFPDDFRSNYGFY